MAITRDELGAVDFTGITTGESIPLTTPGDVLLTEFMAPLNLSSYALARATGVPANRITAILHGTRAVTADTALRLAAHFGTSAELWMTLQMKYDLAKARQSTAVSCAPGVTI